MVTRNPLDTRVQPAHGVCELCSVAGPTRRVHFAAGLGLLLFRWEWRVQGDLCRTCVDATFRDYTRWTALLGWWGLSSFFLNWVYLLNNLLQRLRTRGLREPPRDARRVVLTGGSEQRLSRYQREVRSSLKLQEQLEVIVARIAPRAEVAPTEALVYVRSVRDRLRAHGKVVSP